MGLIAIHAHKLPPSACLRITADASVSHLFTSILISSRRRGPLPLRSCLGASATRRSSVAVAVHGPLPLRREAVFAVEV